MFQPLYYTLKTLSNSERVISWNYNGLLTEKLTTPTTTDNKIKFLQRLNGLKIQNFV